MKRIDTNLTHMRWTKVSKNEWHSTNGLYVIAYDIYDAHPYRLVCFGKTIGFFNNLHDAKARVSY